MLHFFLNFLLRWIFKMCMPERWLKGGEKRRSKNDWRTFTKKKSKELKKKWKVGCFGSLSAFFCLVFCLFLKQPFFKVT